MAVELRNVLVRLGGRSLPATLLFDYPHLDALSSHLYQAWGLDFDAIRIPRPRAPHRPMTTLPISQMRKPKPCCLQNSRMAMAAETPMKRPGTERGHVTRQAGFGGNS